MKFVDVAKYKFVLEPRYYFFGWSGSSKVLARKSAIEQLVKARKLLPKGYNFKIWDAQRPRSVQLAMLDSFRRRFSTLRIRRGERLIRLSRSEIEKMVFTFGAKPLLCVTRLDTHRNGGSFDLTVVDRSGKELYMGTDHDDLTERAGTDYFEKKPRLTASELEARKNRRLLKRIMLKTKFLNYHREWWHWSWPK